MQNYLFVHVREKTTPDGEQVYFAISRDGFHWEALNNGQPVLWAYYGDHGVRDMTICRDEATGRFHIFATDLSLSLGMRGKYNHSWHTINRIGSKALAHWYSDDLVNWTTVKTLLTDRTVMNDYISLTRHAFQYVDWTIDGDDLLFTVREALGDSENYHNANNLTFYRLENYRAFVS